MARRVGVIGLGHMGSVMARRLLAAGFEVWVNNRSSARAQPLLDSGARWSDSGESMAADVELLITMVSDDAALHAVATGEGGVLARPRPGLVYADMSSVSPGASAAVAAAATSAGVHYLRAPVSGSTTLAEQGALRILVSGPHEPLAACDDVFAALGQRVFYLGPGEEARVMKLALNTLVATTVVGLGEALVLGERAGLAWQSMLDVFSDSAVASPLVRYKAASLSSRDFEAAFTTSMMSKDLDVALYLGREAGVPMPVTALCQELLRATCGLGWRDHDFSSAVLMFERLSGVSDG